MAPGFWQRLDLLGRRAVPFAATLALLVLSMLPWPVPGAAPVSPLPALAAVYYWSVHRPELMPPLAVFGLGLAQDLIGGGPVGLNALVLLLVRGMIVGQARRHFARGPFVVDWWGFAVAAGASGALSWVLASLYHGTLVWPKPLLVQYLLNICLYPAISLVFGWMRAGLLRLG